MINVTLVGTGGMIPLPNRFLSSSLLEYNGKSILVDCGEGTQISLHKGGCKITKIEVILITHCHADHVTGLPGLLLTLGNNGRTQPVYIYTPRGGGLFINSLLSVCGYLPFEIKIYELAENKPFSFEQIGIKITSIPLTHHINCIGYCFELFLKPRFLPENAKKLDIPKKFWSLLHNGKSVEIEDREIKPDMVLGEERKSIKISYATDTRPNEHIYEIVQSSDLFICEGMYGDDEQYENAVEKKHMLFSEAAQIAKDSNVSELWLTHYSPSLKNPEEFINKTKEIFSNTVLGYDLMSKEIRRE
jgi:ribonuclease Z